MIKQSLNTQLKITALAVLFFSAQISLMQGAIAQSGAPVATLSHAAAPHASVKAAAKTTAVDTSATSETGTTTSATATDANASDTATGGTTAAAAGAPPAGDGNQQPVDIQAAEQEFLGDRVLAKGNVRVVYKDSVITGPEATLFKDATGQMQRAIFTGHPHLVQTQSKMDADILTFEIATEEIVADGHAHSEVSSEDDASTKPQAQVKSNMIFTDSEHQEYDHGTGKFTARGHVHVIHDDIDAKSDKLQMVYGTDNKPETAIFTGNADAKQNSNVTKADQITYYLHTKRLQASGHVQSKVIQQKKTADADTDAGKSTDKGDVKKVAAAQAKPQAVSMGFDQPAEAAQAAPVTHPSGDKATGTDTQAADKPKDETVTLLGDSEEMSQQTGRITVDGNVKMYYQDTLGIGPRAIIVRNSDGKPQKIYFIGRSQILQPGKRWIADHLTFTVADKKVLAVGNSRAIIKQQTTTPSTTPAPTTPATPNNVQPTNENSQVAQKQNGKQL